MTKIQVILQQKELDELLRLIGEAKDFVDPSKVDIDAATTAISSLTKEIISIYDKQMSELLKVDRGDTDALEQWLGQYQRSLGKILAYIETIKKENHNYFRHYGRLANAKD